METMRPIDRILELMARHGLKQRVIAQAAGVEESRVSDWKSGKATLSPAHLHGLAVLFGVSMDWLWTGEESPRAGLRNEDDELVLEEMKRQKIDHLEAIRRLRTPRVAHVQLPTVPGPVGGHTVARDMALEDAIDQLTGKPTGRPDRKQVRPKSHR